MGIVQVVRWVLGGGSLWVCRFLLLLGFCDGGLWWLVFVFCVGVGFVDRFLCFVCVFIF